VSWLHSQSEHPFQQPWDLRSQKVAKGAVKEKAGHSDRNLGPRSRTIGIKLRDGGVGRGAEGAREAGGKRASEACDYEKEKEGGLKAPHFEIKTKVVAGGHALKFVAKCRTMIMCSRGWASSASQRDGSPRATLRWTKDFASERRNSRSPTGMIPGLKRNSN
jgi:hypothetical protein